MIVSERGQEYENSALKIQEIPSETVKGLRIPKLYKESMALLPGRIFSLALRKLRRWRPEIKNLI